MSLLRKARRGTFRTLMFWGCLMIPASAFLYSTNAHVRALENDIEATDNSVAQEKESLRVLRAEWAYLNSPERLAAETKHYLSNTQVASAKQVLPMQNLTAKVAMRETQPEDNGVMQIAGAPASSSAMLAKPISYDGGLLAALHRDEQAKIPASASWTQKMVSALGFSSSLPSLKSRSVP